MPNKATKTGKAANADLAEIAEVPDVRFALPSMPPCAIAEHGSRAYSPGIVRSADTVWVQWDCDLPALIGEANTRHADQRAQGYTVADDLPLPDPDLWERVPLSTYYQLVEAGQDPFAEPTTKENR